jgi:hypothetical protein
MNERRSNNLASHSCLDNAFVDYWGCVSREFIRLIGQLDVMDGLYGDEECSQVLRNSAESTFGILQRCLLDSIILSMTRLLDPYHGRKIKASDGGGWETSLCLEGLIHLLPIELQELQVCLERVLGEACDQAVPMRSHLRNKIIAHHDERVGLNSIAVYQGAEMETIDSVYGKMLDFMDLIAEAMCQDEGTLHGGWVGLFKGTPCDLIHLLQKGLFEQSTGLDNQEGCS